MKIKYKFKKYQKILPDLSNLSVGSIVIFLLTDSSVPWVSHVEKNKGIPQEITEINFGKERTNVNICFKDIDPIALFKASGVRKSSWDNFVEQWRKIE